MNINKICGPASSKVGLYQIRNSQPQVANIKLEVESTGSNLFGTLMFYDGEEEDSDEVIEYAITVAEKMGISRLMFSKHNKINVQKFGFTQHHDDSFLSLNI